MTTPAPTEINLNRKTRILTVSFAEGESFAMSCEYLRVHSPSAEVQGHGHGQGVLQLGKEGVNIDSIEPVGNYAIKLVFDDGHDTGIYSWGTLYTLGRDQEKNWRNYLQDLQDAGHQRKMES